MRCQSELIEKYCQGKDPEWEASNMEVRKGRLTGMYGTTLLVRRPEKVEGKRVFVLNAASQRGAVGWSAQQGRAHQGVSRVKGFLVSIPADVLPFKLSEAELVDAWMDESRSRLADEEVPEARPGETITVYRDKDGEPTSWYGHRPGCSVWKAVREGESEWSYFLIGLDDQTYFVTLLAGPVKTVQEAFDGMMPEGIKRAKQQGMEVKRQGEWYFVNVSDVFETRELPGPSLRTMVLDLSRAAMPRIEHDNIHVATEGRTWGNEVFVRGTVRHIGKYGQTRRVSWGQLVEPLHPMLKLPGGWWQAVRNTTRGGWNAEGGFD